MTTATCRKLSPANSHAHLTPPQKGLIKYELNNLQ